MVSLWGSKDGEEDQTGDRDPNAENGEGSGPNGGRRSHEADERTRLLPPRRDGYLDPDDPAASATFSDPGLIIS